MHRGECSDDSSKRAQAVKDGKRYRIQRAIQHNRQEKQTSTRRSVSLDPAFSVYSENNNALDVRVAVTSPGSLKLSPIATGVSNVSLMTTVIDDLALRVDEVYLCFNRGEFLGAEVEEANARAGRAAVHLELANGGLDLASAVKYLRSGV